MKSKTGLWREMLYAARELAAEGKITSSAFAEMMGIHIKVASAYLCLLGKWGYIRRVEKETVNGRWGWIWELTDFGVNYKPATKGASATPPARQRGQVPLKIAANPGKKK